MNSIQFQSAIKYDNTFIKPYFRLSSSLLEISNFSSALTHAKLGLEIDPNHVPLLKVQRAAILAEKNKKISANTKAATDAKSIKPKQPLAMPSLYDDKNLKHGSARAIIAQLKSEVRLISSHLISSRHQLRPQITN